MDFVVVGLGLGACAVLAGVILLGWHLPRAERALAIAADPAAIAAAEDAVAATRGGGQVMLSAGGAIILATIGALAGSLDDRTGAFFVVTTVTVAALGILAWGYLNRTRIPWVSPRRSSRRFSSPAAEPLFPATLLAPVADAFAVQPTGEDDATADEIPVGILDVDDEEIGADSDDRRVALVLPTELDAEEEEAALVGRGSRSPVDDDS